MAKKIAAAVKALGGRTYYVGGFVRDRLAGRDNKDVDIEVHGITPSELEGILDSLGGRMSMGESFGIYGIKGYSLDIAMPRKEKQNGKGHKDFDVLVDAFIGAKKAAMRRDFTVNALMQDVLTDEVVDCFDGITDLENKVIRHVNDESFTEDALRVLRAAQFAARFEFTVAPQTVELCRKVPLCNLPKERIMGELEKALMKADRPSVFFETLRETDKLDEWFPELKALIGVKQNPEHHLEGDVWTHTMLVLDTAAKYRAKVERPLPFMMSALTHDMGKAVCTEVINGKIHSYDHETKGLPLVSAFVKRLTNETYMLKYVLNMTKLHMKPNILAANNSSVKATNKMFDQSVDPIALIYLATADSLCSRAARGYLPHDEFLKTRLAIFEEYMSRPFVTGKDLVENGLKPTPLFTEYLEFAHKLRLAGVDKQSALKQTLAYAAKHNRTE